MEKAIYIQKMDGLLEEYGKMTAWFMITSKYYLLVMINSMVVSLITAQLEEVDKFCKRARLDT